MCKYFEIMQLSDVAVETVKYLLLYVQCVYVLKILVGVGAVFLSD